MLLRDNLALHGIGSLLPTPTSKRRRSKAMKVTPSAFASCAAPGPFELLDAVDRAIDRVSLEAGSYDASKGAAQELSTLWDLECLVGAQDPPRHQD